ncbi:Hypothetical predicted protein [Mytilus galloprovincialis]|uniref:BEN domain-containing protein n=1 Tax=Mytilus galloprovincialis TaxID=29158 RepID=A0A8B6FMD4_MYTGA|nr:Hypothetical predicted protein [Mytilus galloprovincialis]
MATRAATREFSHFLVRYDDGTLYTCPRVKVNIEGRVRIGERYPVTYGSSVETPETAEVLDTGDYILMKSREKELNITSPSLPPTPSSPESLPPSPFKIRKRKLIGRTDNKPKKARQEAVMLSIGDGIDDPFQYRSPSVTPELPLHLSAPTPPSPPLPPSPIDRLATLPTVTSAATQTTPTHKDPPAFSIQQSLQAMEKQLTVANTRLSEVERIMTSFGNMIKEMKQTQYVTPLPLAPVPLPRPSTPTTPRPHLVLPNLPVTPTTPQLPDSPLPQPLTPTLRRVLPVHLFNDLPDSVRLSEDDLSRLSCCANNPGAFAVLLLKHFYPELFTADQLRVYYSYRGGGKLSKRPLDDSRKAIIKRYVVAMYPSVNTESAYHAMVVEKINQYLRRPVQPAQKV